MVREEYCSPEDRYLLHGPAEHPRIREIAPIQWVASPLNQSYSFLTRMSGKGEMEDVMRERTVARCGPSLNGLMIYRRESGVQTLTCKSGIYAARINDRVGIACERINI